MNPNEYDQMFELEDRYWWFVSRRQLALGLLRKHLGARKSKPVILDLGCGTGVISRELTLWSTPISLDMSPRALGYCQKRGLRRLVLADGQHLPFQNESVDAVIGLDIYEHIEDDARALAETYRVLKPGGLVVLSVPAYMSLWGPHDIALMHFRRYRRAEVGRRLTTAGFDLVRLGYSVFFLFPAVLLVRLLDKRKQSPARTTLPRLPASVNSALVGIQNVETAMIDRVSLPWGSSVISVARKPADKHSRSGPRPNLASRA